MDRSRWICLLVVGLYVIIGLVFPLPGDEPATGPSEEGLSTGHFAGGVLLVLGFVCVWWSEILGDALWMGRGAWKRKPSSAGTVRVLGWTFLIGAFVLHVVLLRRGAP